MDRRGALKLILGAAAALPFSGCAMAQISDAEHAEVETVLAIKKRILEEGGVAFWFREMPEGYGLDTFPVYQNVKFISDLSDVSAPVKRLFAEVKDMARDQGERRRFEMSLYGIMDEGVRKVVSYVSSDIDELEAHALDVAARIEKKFGDSAPERWQKELVRCRDCAIV
ncbi:MAG: hypothetical protein R3E13_04005 [Alphaproteobacteria bacterium]